VTGVAVRVAQPWEVPTPAELDPELGFRLAGWNTVLIVEDDQRVRAMARRVLGGQAYRVLEALSGADAIRVAGQANQIDLVLTSVDMPTTGVRSMLRRLKDRNPEMKIILMSGYSDPELLSRGIDIGNDRFISKPFTGLTLVAEVQDALRPSAVPQRES
jgi:CheY-like chemotaxis protein